MDDVEVFRIQFLRRVRTVAPDHDIGAVLIHSEDGLAVVALGPLGKYQLEAAERVRRFEPIATVPWEQTVSIVVEPSRIDVPSIEKVIVHRNNLQVAPLSSTLAANEMTTRMGAKTRIHSGSVTFPLSTFAPTPGILVRVTLVPVSGSNIVKTFRALDLRELQ